MEDQYSPRWPARYSSSGWPAVPADEKWIGTSSAAYGESFLVPWLLPTQASDLATFQVNGFVPIQEASEDRAASISKSHSQAEKRRRDRINAQLGILRKLIPKSDKMDKAALLGSVIDHVKDLKQKAMEVGKVCTIPTEADEVTVDCDVSEILSPTHINKENIFIRASLCCEDRPELFPELVRALEKLNLAIVRADIASVGGRVKSILLLCNKDSTKEAVSLDIIKQSLNLVLSRIASSSMSSNYRIRSKRQRFFLPSH